MKPLRARVMEQIELGDIRPPWLPTYDQILGHADVFIAEGPVGSAYIGVRPTTSIRAYDRMIPIMLINQKHSGAELYDMLEKTTFGPEHRKLIAANREKIIEALDDTLYKKNKSPLPYKEYLKQLASRPTERIKKTKAARRKQHRA